MNIQKNQVVIITIDGPSGAGKGTLSQLLAKHLGYHLLDSGALYRLVALAAIKAGVNLQDEAAVTAVASNLEVVFDVTGESTRILLAGNDVTDDIRLENVSMSASIVAAIPSVRSALLQRQKDFAVAPGLIADGRDMGTTVFPHAQAKIFLTASAEARAERRYKQLIDKGVSADLDEIVVDIKARDERDTNRSASPLLPAADALILDSTSLTIQQVMDSILGYVRSRVD